MQILKATIDCNCIYCEHFWKTCLYCRLYKSMSPRCSSRDRDHGHIYTCVRCDVYFPFRGDRNDTWFPFTQSQIEAPPREIQTLEQINQDHTTLSGFSLLAWEWEQPRRLPLGRPSNRWGLLRVVETSLVIHFLVSLSHLFLVKNVAVNFLSE